MKKIILFTILFVAAVSCTSESNRSDSWEYKVIEIDGSGYSNFEPLTFDADNEVEQLNTLGEDGWELVGVYTIVGTVHPNFGNSDYVTGIRENTRTRIVKYVFKRPK